MDLAHHFDGENRKGQKHGRANQSGNRDGQELFCEASASFSTQAIVGRPELARDEGWTMLPALYDDGGFSGGTMDCFCDRMKAAQASRWASSELKA
jgi:hypothetical protein